MKAWMAVLVAAGTLLANNAFAELRVDRAWVRATVPQQSTTAVYLRLTAVGSDVRVGAASTPVAGMAEFHRMRMDNEIARMEHVDGIDLKAGGTLELQPGGYHLMLMDLKGPLKAGQRVPIMFRYREGSRDASATVEAEVRALNAGPPEGQAR